MFIQTLARMLAAKFNLVVEFSPTVQTFSIGRRPDGSLVVTMATRVLEAKQENEEAIGVLFRGALAHEALGHGYHTDFSEEALAKEGPFARSLANAFEDVRIEALAPARFLGAKRLLAEMAETLDRDLQFWSVEDDDWQACLLIGLLRKYRTQILHQALDQAKTERQLAVAKAALGVELFARVDALAEAACQSGSTAEVSATADEIVRVLRAAQPQSSPPTPQSSVSDSGNRGEDGDASAQDGAADGEQGADESASESRAAESGNSAGEGQESGAKCGPGSDNNGAADEGGAEGAAANGGEAGHEAGEEAGKADGEADGDNAAGQGRGTGAEDCANAGVPALGFDENKECNVDVEAGINAVSNPRGDYLEATNLDANRSRDDSESLLQVANEIALQQPDKLVQRIASRLGEVVRSITDDADDEEADMGRLDMARLPAIAAGMAHEPFLVDGNPGRGIDTEIMLLMDASGSMRKLGRDFLCRLLRSSALALARFSPDLGVSVATFAEDSRLLVKPGQRITPRLASALSTAYYPGGGTEWSVSVIPLVPLLAQSRRRRKILLTVTDGQIDSTPNSGLLRDMAIHGIECRFVSIGNQLPLGFDGVECAAEANSFANAFCDTILASLPPAYA